VVGNSDFRNPSSAESPSLIVASAKTDLPAHPQPLEALPEAAVGLFLAIKCCRAIIFALTVTELIVLSPDSFSFPHAALSGMLTLVYGQTT
jgi:hypothetical protein